MAEKELESLSHNAKKAAEELKKQMKYADQKQIPFVVLAGENEINRGLLTVKNMKSGEQSSLTADQLIEMVLAG